MAALAALVPVAALGGFVLGQEHAAHGRASLPVLGEAPSYTLRNQLGADIPSSRFAGKVQLVTFLFPYCTTLCPLIAAHLINLENMGLAPAGLADKVAIVSFNLDPADTGPAQMRAFLSQYGWDPHNPNWQFLTGTPAAVDQVVRKGYSVFYKRVSLAEEAAEGDDGMVQPEVENKLAQSAHVDYDIVHNDVLEVVDQHGRIRKIYGNADTVDWTRLLTLVQSLIGTGAA